MKYLKYAIFISIILTILLGAHVSAQMFCDSASNLYSFQANSASKSSDHGQTWTNISLPMTYEAKYAFAENSDNTLYLFWINNKTLFVSEGTSSNMVFSAPRELFPGFVCNKYKIIIDNGIWNLYYSISGKLFFAASYDKGLTFTAFRQLNNSYAVVDWNVIKTTNSQTLAIASQNNIYIMDTASGFSLQKEAYKTKNNIFKLVDFKNPFIPKSAKAIWAEQTAFGARIMYLPSPEALPVQLYQANNRISSLEATYINKSILLTYSEFIGQDAAKPYLLKIKDDGSAINSPIDVYGNINKTVKIESSYPINNKYAIFHVKDNTIAIDFIGNYSPTVSILSPGQLFKTCDNQISFSIFAMDQNNDDLNKSLLISGSEKFLPENSWTYGLVSKKASILLPFPDGRYYAKAVVSDGISLVSSDNISIVLDRIVPNIYISNSADELLTSQASLEISGILSKEARLTINGAIVSLEAGFYFQKVVSLNPGDNSFTCIATDEAGNVSSEVIVAFYNADAPQITITNPTPRAYYKSGSLISVKATVVDKASDLQDETEAELILGGNKLADTLTYSSDDSSLTGLVSLPENIADGKHKLGIILKDANNNHGTTFIDLIVDNTCPQLLTSSISPSFKAITFPYKEEGSGLDLSSSHMNLFRGSLEAVGKLKIEDSTLIFVPEAPLLEGTYRLDYSLRDLVGNSSSMESININISSINASSIMLAASTEAKIISVKNGPNPFNPANGGNTTIKYILSSPANIEFYVFSLNGNILYSKKFSSPTTSGSFNWDGHDCFGNNVVSGLYPYIFISSNAGAKDYRRGKMIVY